MERVIKNSSVYLGLFLIAFALFAQEKLNVGAAPVHDEIVTPAVEAEKPSPTLDALFKKLKLTYVFETPPDGVKIIRQKQSILISLQSDELYLDGEIGVQETWYPVLGQIGDAVFPELGDRYKIQIKAFANSLNARETASVALSRSPYLFSASRAEWLLRYYESKYRLKLGINDSIAGGGAIPNGKRLEISVTEQSVEAQ